LRFATEHKDLKGTEAQDFFQNNIAVPLFYKKAVKYIQYDDSI
jgi:hypothetical protein